MLQSIIVYTLTGFILYALGRNLALRDARMQQTLHHPTSFWCTETWLSILVFATVAGLRYNVGVDHLMYLQFYEDMAKQGWITRETLEPGFLFIMKVFTELNLHFFFFFAFLAAIQLFFIYFALRDQKQVLPYIGLFIMLNSYFLSLMNGIRQYIAICIFVFAIEFIQQRKLIPYICSILLATLIHKSAYILLPLYFIFTKPFIYTNKKILISLYIISVIIGLTPQWVTKLTEFGDFYNLLGYENYTNSFETKLENLNSYNVGPRRLSVILFNIIIIIYYPSILKRFKLEDKLPYYFNCFFIGVCMYNLFLNSIVAFIRPVLYFSFFSLIMAAYCALFLKEERKYKCLFFFLLLICVYIYISIYTAVAEPNNSITYKFFFDKL